MPTDIDICAQHVCIDVRIDMCARRGIALGHNDTRWLFVADENSDSVRCVARCVAAVLPLCCGMVLCCAVMCAAVRCSAVRYGTVRYGAVRRGAVRRGAVRCITVVALGDDGMAPGRDTPSLSNPLVLLIGSMVNKLCYSEMGLSSNPPLVALKL